MERKCSAGCLCVTNSFLKVKNITVDHLRTFPVHRSILIAFLLLFIVTDQWLSKSDTLFQIRLSLSQYVCICTYIHVVRKRKILIIFWVRTIIKDSCIKLQSLCWIFFLLSIPSSIRGQCCEYTAYWSWHIESKAFLIHLGCLLFIIYLKIFKRKKGGLEMVGGNSR